MRSGASLKYLQDKNWLVHLIALGFIEEAVSFSKGLLLDIGCGQKPYLKLFEPHVEAYIGLEHPNTQSKSQVVDIYGDTLNLPFRGESFDTIVSFQVLEHVPEPDKMISEIERVLKKGGYLILTAPHIWGLHEEPNDYFRFTKYGLKYLLRKNGFEIVYIKAMAGYWVTAGQRFCYYLEHFRYKRLIGSLIPMLWFIVQHLALWLDRLHRVESDAWNYIAVGKKI